MEQTLEKQKSEWRFGCIDGTVLKLIAMATMLIDHIGDIFFPDVFWMRFIGRIAMPIFSFCIAEGFSYTRDKKKYLLRLGIFALISELPFDLAFFREFLYFGHQNVMVTFFLTVLTLVLWDRITAAEGKPKPTQVIAGIIVLMAMCIFAILLSTDYSCFGIMTVWIFYQLRKQAHWLRSLVGVGFLALTRTMGYNIGVVLSLIPLLLYNGKKGKGLKWLFYVFYPGHLLVLYLIYTLIN